MTFIHAMPINTVNNELAILEDAKSINVEVVNQTFNMDKIVRFTKRFNLNFSRISLSSHNYQSLNFISCPKYENKFDRS